VCAEVRQSRRLVCVCVCGEETGASEIGDSTQTAKSRCLRLSLLQQPNVLVLPILCFDVHGPLKPLRGMDEI